MIPQFCRGWANPMRWVSWHHFQIPDTSVRAQQSGRSRLRSMRAWNILAITALADGADGSWAIQLFKQLKAFSVTYFNALSSYTKPSGLVLDMALADINQADVAIKLWLVLAKKFENSCQFRESVYDTVWNELWPPFEAIIDVLEMETQDSVSSVSYQISGFWIDCKYPLTWF